MQAQIAALKKRYDEIAHRLCEPDVLADAAQYRALTRESKQLTPVVAAADAYLAAVQAVREAQAMLDDPATDREIRELAEQEIRDHEARAAGLAEQIRRMMLPRDPNDDRNVIMEIRGGAGGEESALFAASLYRMYSMYAAARGWRIEPVSQNPTPLGGLKEISFMIAGEGAYSRLKYESGGHRVQRVPEPASSGRLHTSAATVAVLPEAEEVEVTIHPADLKIDT
ncbi:MAG: PCRF domain-containing protein, partial [Clostridia bacterium]|nr:PCRF domain-containing protein [Clostridia bacterium]